MGWKRDVLTGLYEATFVQKFKTSQAGGGGQIVNQNVVAVANPQTGSFDLYKVSKVGGIEVSLGRGEPFANISGETGKVTVFDQSTFDAFYDGPDGQAQLRTFTRSAPSGFYNQLKNSNDPFSVQQAKNLEGKQLYASLGNQAQTPSAGASSNEPKSDTTPDPQAPLAETGGQPVSGSEESSTPLTINQDNFTRADFAEDEKIDTLTYPEKILKDSDYLDITCYSYIPTRFTSGSISLPEAGENLKGVESIGTVRLPIQSASESNTVSWGDDRLNALQIAGAGIAGDLLGNFSRGDIIGGSKKAIRAVQSALASAGADLSESDIIAYFAGQAVNSNIYTRSTGQVLNDNLELLFGGTTLRSFSFNYRFTPRSNPEALKVKKIIKFFKKQMAPKKSKNNLFLGTPNIFKLKYIYGKTGSQHPYLNQIKVCALVGFNVNYVPDNSYMTYQDGSMTSYDVAMSFKEINPIYSSDISLNDGPNETGTGY